MTPKDLPELLAFIAGDPLLHKAKAHLESLLDDDPGHDLSHALRVALWTLRLGNSEFDPRLGILAALYHDVVNLPKNSPDRAQASLRSAAVAREAMQRLECSEPEIILVTDAVRDHSYSRGATPNTRLGKALQDADRLEALGVLGIFRTVSCGTQMGSVYFHSADPWANKRELNDRKYMVDHFFQKLLHVETTMLTDAGAAEARRRTQYLREFLAQLSEELGTPLDAPSLRTEVI